MYIKGARHNQSFEQKVENLRMVLIDQVVGEIIVNNVCVLCELEKNWINRLQTYKELNCYIDYILSRGCPHKPKQNNCQYCTYIFDTFYSCYSHVKCIF